MTYGKVENNQIVEYNRTLPFSSKNTSFGKNTPVEVMAQMGYLPIIGTEPSYDASTHKNAGVSYEIVGNEIHKTYNIVEIPTEEIMETKKEQFKQAIDTMIVAKCKELGYDSENSIAKYLVIGNPFYDECSSLSLWIGSVWTVSHQIMADVLAGARAIPTLDELLKELPKL